MPTIRPPQGRTMMLSPTISLRKLNHGEVLKYIKQESLSYLHNSRAIVSKFRDVEAAAYRFVVPASQALSLNPTLEYRRMTEGPDGEATGDSSLLFSGDILGQRKLPHRYMEYLQNSSAPPYVFAIKLTDRSWDKHLYKRQQYWLLGKIPAKLLNTTVNPGKLLMRGSDGLEWDVVRCVVTTKDSRYSATTNALKDARFEVLRQAVFTHITTPPELREQKTVFPWPDSNMHWTGEAYFYPLKECWSLSDVCSRFATVVEANLMPVEKKVERPLSLMPTTAFGLMPMSLLAARLPDIFFGTAPSSCVLIGSVK